MSSQELRVVDFVDGNMDLYNARCIEVLSRALTARETVMSICDGGGEYDEKVCKIAEQTLREVYKGLVEEFHRIPDWSTLLQYLEAESCEAICELSELYWTYHEDHRDDRQEYYNLVASGLNEKAENKKEDSISSICDWIMESEFSYYGFTYTLAHSYSGVLTLLMNLDLPFIVNSDSADILEQAEIIPEYLNVIVNDAQNALFPKMAGPLRGLFDPDEWSDTPVYGLVCRKELEDILLLEQGKAG